MYTNISFISVFLSSFLPSTHSSFLSSTPELYGQNIPLPLLLPSKFIMQHHLEFVLRNILIKKKRRSLCNRHDFYSKMNSVAQKKKIFGWQVLDDLIDTYSITLKIRHPYLSQNIEACLGETYPVLTSHMVWRAPVPTNNFDVQLLSEDAPFKTNVAQRVHILTYSSAYNRT